MENRIRSFIVVVVIMIIICIVPLQVAADSVSSSQVAEQTGTVTFWWDQVQVWWSQIQQLWNSLWTWFVSLMHGLGL